LRDDVENLAPGVLFFVSVKDGPPVGSYTTNGVDEPYCFWGLQPNVYIVRSESPRDYITTSRNIATLALTNQPIYFALGLRPADRRTPLPSSIGIIVTVVISALAAIVVAMVITRRMGRV
jgi:hypothetical protein